jgi:hypothetical protein
LVPTLWEEHKLRKIFGPTEEEIIGNGRKLHNEELKRLGFLPNVIGVIKSENLMGRARGIHGREKICTGFVSYT